MNKREGGGTRAKVNEDCGCTAEVCTVDEDEVEGRGFAGVRARVLGCEAGDMLQVTE